MHEELIHLADVEIVRLTANKHVAVANGEYEESKRLESRLSSIFRSKFMLAFDNIRRTFYANT